MKNIDRFHIGTSGLNVPIRQSEYPPGFEGKSRLEYYASIFNSIEINSSFYQLPKPATVAKWVNYVPGNFTFTFKVSKLITHVKGLAFNDEDIDAFMDAISVAKNKQGCLLVQFPPGLKIDKLNEFQNLLSALDAANKDAWKIAVECRHSSWYEREVYELLDEFNCSLVIQDIPASAAPFTREHEGLKYLRFHGPGGKYRGSYDEAFIKNYAAYINEWLKENKKVYCYFNNTIGDAFQNAESLKSLIA
jgi:uncharacterized protein YecE (DUF72 family)